MEWTPDNTKSLRTWRGNYEINQRFLNRAADEIERLKERNLELLEAVRQMQVERDTAMDERLDEIQRANKAEADIASRNKTIAEQGAEIERLKALEPKGER